MVVVLTQDGPVRVAIPPGVVVVQGTTFTHGMSDAPAPLRQTLRQFTVSPGHRDTRPARAGHQRQPPSNRGQVS